MKDKNYFARWQSHLTDFYLSLLPQKKIAIADKIELLVGKRLKKSMKLSKNKITNLQTVFLCVRRTN
jgi:hypothetical protein